MESIGARAAPNRSNRGAGAHHLPGLGLFLLASTFLPHQARAQVLLIGDSITQGGVSGTPAGPPYADVAATELGASFDVHNLGCGGSTSLDWLPYIGVTICPGIFVDLWQQRIAPNTPADIATIMLGTNDATGFFEPENQPVAPADYAAALEAIIDAPGPSPQPEHREFEKKLHFVRFVSSSFKGKSKLKRAEKRIPLEIQRDRAHRFELSKA